MRMVAVIRYYNVRFYLTLRDERERMWFSFLEDAFALKTDAVHACPHALSDGGFHCGVNIPPEPYDVWVGCAPCIHKGAEFVFGKSHLKSTH